MTSKILFNVPQTATADIWLNSLPRTKLNKLFARVSGHEFCFLRYVENKKEVVHESIDTRK